ADVLVAQGVPDLVVDGVLPVPGHVRAVRLRATHPARQVDQHAAEALAVAGGFELDLEAAGVRPVGGLRRGEAHLEGRVREAGVHALERDLPVPGPALGRVRQGALHGRGESVVTGVARRVDAVLDLDGVRVQLSGADLRAVARDDVPLARARLRERDAVRQLGGRHLEVDRRGRVLRDGLLAVAVDGAG